MLQLSSLSILWGFVSWIGWPPCLFCIFAYVYGWLYVYVYIYIYLKMGIRWCTHIHKVLKKSQKFLLWGGIQGSIVIKVMDILLNENNVTHCIARCWPIYLWVSLWHKFVQSFSAYLSPSGHYMYDLGGEKYASLFKTAQRGLHNLEDRFFASWVSVCNMLY